MNGAHYQSLNPTNLPSQLHQIISSLSSVGLSPPSPADAPLCATGTCSPSLAVIHTPSTLLLFFLTAKLFFDGEGPSTQPNPNPDLSMNSRSALSKLALTPCRGIHEG